MFGPVGCNDEDWGAGTKEGFGFDPSFRCENIDGSNEAVKGFGFFELFVAFEGIKFL